MANERYTLMIVDDEDEIRQGLRSFGYAALGIEVSAACENGLFALQALEQEPVDMMVTDIRMPLMDGLELAEKVASRFPHTKIIILSGYDDFEYAKACMKYGALDYLLKPLDFAEYESVLAKAVRLISQEKEQQAKAVVLERKAKLSAYRLRQKFLRDLLHRAMGEEEVEQESALAEVMLEQNGPFAVCLLRLSAYPDRPRGVGDKDWGLILFTLDNLLYDLWDEQGMGYHYVDAQGQCALIATLGAAQAVANGDQAAADSDAVGPSAAPAAAAAAVAADSLRERLDALMAGLKRFRGLFKSHLSYVVGPVVAKPEHIRHSCREAGALFQATADGIAVEPVHSANPRELPDADHRSAACGEDGGEGRKEEGPEQEQAQEPAAGHRLVQEAIRFIELHYDRTITLDDVARHVHLNASYLSFLFKEVTGQKYIDYLTVHRIEQAKGLLLQTNHKILEIAQMVGYENPRYFTLVFKKYTRLSPVEYRNSGFHEKPEGGGL